jgi:hypothetical protein
LAQERVVVSVVDRTRREHEFFPHQVEERSERFDGWRNEIPLDPRDRGLGRSRTCRKLRLGEAVPPASVAHELAWRHATSISDQM